MKLTRIIKGITFIISTGALAQIGVNTPTPKTTMDVSAKRNTGGNITDFTQTLGLQAPRVTRTELTTNLATYGADQQGALIYITDVSGGTATGQRANIDEVGYYFFDGSNWQKVLYKNIYNADGSITAPGIRRTLTLNGKELSYQGTSQRSFWSADGSLNQSASGGGTVGNVSIYGGNDSNLYIQQFRNSNASISTTANSTALSIGTHATAVSAPVTINTSAGGNALATEKMRITGEGNVGIGTTSPNTSAILDLTSSNKGFLMPRVSLTSATDVTTIASPAAGLMVYNLATAGSNDTTVKANTVYYWNGTRWNELGGTQSSSQTGSTVYKTKYRGRNLMANSYPKPTLFVPEENLEYRFADNPSGTNRLQVRLINAPTTNVSVFITGLWAGDSNSGSYYDLTFTTGNYNVWQNIDTRSWSGIWSYYFVIATNEVRATGYNPSNYVMNLYGLCGWGNGWGATNEPFSLAAEVF